MTHKADKQYATEYTYAGKRWCADVWADDMDDARRKLRAMSNGEVLGPIALSIPVPGGGLLSRLLAWWRNA